MDHRLIDSCGLIVMINDLMQLYTHYRFGSDFPKDLADFETVLSKDLEKLLIKKILKDKNFGMIS